MRRPVCAFALRSKTTRRDVVDCLIIAAERGRQAYFFAHGDTSTLKDFSTALLATRGMPPVKRTAPFALVWRMAGLMEGAWRLFGIRSKPQ